MVEEKNANNPLGYDFKVVKENIEDLALYASSSRPGHAFVVHLFELQMMLL